MNSTMHFWQTWIPDEALPKMLLGRQQLKSAPIADLDREISTQFGLPGVREKIRPGMKIAVGVGSRGVTNLARIVRAVADNLKQLEARPFLFPAMGSHGGATPEGQLEVLASYGITEASMGAPIQASMQVVEVGENRDKIPIYADKEAAQADGIIVINRVKLHTSFRGEVESGLLKMLVIGMGNQQGARMTHSQGFDRFHELIPEIGEQILARMPVLFGLAIVEDGRHATARIEFIENRAIRVREAQLLEEAREMFPRIPFEEFDILVVSEIGKNISGCGMDPNVIGRYSAEPLRSQTHEPRILTVVILGLSPETHGNAIGMGGAEVITRRLYESVDYQKTYANGFTAGELSWVRLPLVAASERDAICVALNTTPRLEPRNARVVWIRNTLELEYLYVSEALRQSHPEALAEWFDPAQHLAFDSEGQALLPEPLTSLLPASA